MNIRYDKVPSNFSVKGENGKGVVINPDDLSEEDRKEYDRGYKLHAFNVYVSDMISLERSIPEARIKE